MTRVRLVAASDLAVPALDGSEDITALAEGSYNVPGGSVAVALGLPSMGGRLEVQVIVGAVSGKLFRYTGAGGSAALMYVTRWSPGNMRPWRQVQSVEV